MNKDIWIAILRHDDSAEPTLKAGTYSECVDAVHDYFLSYGFEIIDGVPYDKGNDLQNGEGYACFDDVIMYGKYKISAFSHCNGDGPVCSIIKSI